MMATKWRAMTEAEWRSSADPARMLLFAKGKLSERKLRLFACACCRSVWDSLRDPLQRDAVEIAERYTDGLADERQLKRARDAILSRDFGIASASAAAAGSVFGGEHPPVWAIEAAAGLAFAEVMRCASEQGRTRIAPGTKEAIHRSQADLFRCIAGPLPFRPVTAGPSWLAPGVVTLARAIDEGPAFDRLPVLGDALENAGCDDPDLLGHCRSRDVHARGCWAVDLVLGKS